MPKIKKCNAGKNKIRTRQIIIKANLHDRLPKLNHHPLYTENFHGDHLKNQNIPNTSPTYITIQPCSPIITTFLNDIMSDVSFDFNQATYRDN